MSDERLSDDLSAWPNDPYALLGVSPADDERTLRLAYTKLIRRFKPEHYPDHFRRLRDAYESLRSAFQWRRRADFPDESDGEGESLPATFPRGPAEKESQPDLQSAVDEAWRLAIDGKIQNAYAALHSLRRRFGPHREVALREYWLLKIAPSLDSSRTRFEPLGEALSCDGFSGPAVSLYTRELERRSEEALHARLVELLEKTTDAPALAILLQMRWQAAARLGRWQVIADDAQRLREVLSDHDEITWAGQLFTAIDQLAWFDDPAAKQSVDGFIGELHSMQHLHFSLSYSFDRLDLLTHLSAGWRKLVADPLHNPAVASVIRLSWSQPFGFYRDECAEIIHAITADPQAGLRMLERVCSIEPALGIQLQFAIQQYHVNEQGYIDDSIDEPDALREQAARYIQAMDWVTYGESTRRKLLQFCLQEAISPELLMELTAEVPGCHDLPAGGDLSAHVTKDAALKCVYAAWRAFWA